MSFLFFSCGLYFILFFLVLFPGRNHIVCVAEIVLKNSTGNRTGFFVMYEYGEDLFGYLYLDIVRGKKHRAKKLKSLLFQDPKEFIITLDLELYRKENLNYLPSN